MHLVEVPCDTNDPATLALLANCVVLHPDDASAAFDDAKVARLEESVSDLLQFVSQETRELIFCLYYERITLEEVAARFGWYLSSGAPDRKRVARARDKALMHLSEASGWFGGYEGLSTVS